MNLVDVLPIPLIGVALLAALTLASMVGVRLRDRRADAGRDNDGYIISADLGLLALLIGFTFSLVLGRYDTRRDLVLREANAIGTTWLRAQFAPEPFRSDLRSLTRRYVDARLALADAGEDAAAITRAEGMADDLQRRIWDTTMAAVPRIEPASAVPLLVSTVNETIDLAEARKTALAARLPGSVLLALLIYALISAGVLGYVMRGNSRISAFVLFVLLALAITLILDLDRTRTGTIVVSQAPMLDLRDWIAATPVRP